MSNEKVYEVRTDLSPDQLTDVAIETYMKWLDWALGKGSLLGMQLRHPSGRYAASIGWRRTGVASVAIFADPSVAPEDVWIESGASAHSMKDAMLGQGDTKISAKGFQYRIIPIRKDGSFPEDATNAEVINSPLGGGLSPNIKKLWARAVPHVDADHFAVMSDAPGASDWIVPSQAPYAPGAILSSLLKQEFGAK